MRKEYTLKPEFQELWERIKHKTRYAVKIDSEKLIRDVVAELNKLPAWFTVPTPIGEYNPDWAIVMEDCDEHGEPTGKPLLYLVRETKSTRHLGELRPDERRKIVCGERHFQDALGVDYKVVVSARELP